MIFGEWVYAAFLIAAALIYRVLPVRARAWWLAACGLTFYAYYSQAFLWLVIAELLVVIVLVRKSRTQVWAYAAALAVTIGTLLVFKYAGLLAASLGVASRIAHLPPLPEFPRLVLPLAISFFTFEFVHYIVDARRGTLPEHSPSEFLAFALFFPTMVAGPIKRFQGFKPQIATARASAQDVNDGITRIALGLAKKLCIADTLTPLTTPLLTTPGMRTATNLELLVALLAFSVKIYADFSGYSDIAIGSSRLFGIQVPENFSWPYLRTNIAQFWRHWHMSLTSWITDYVYIPLGGSRNGLALTAANSIVAMGVSGLWHGAQWHFLVWGVYHGVLLALYRVWIVLVKGPLRERAEGRRGRPMPSALHVIAGAAGVAVTFTLVTVGWGLFVMPVDRFAEMIRRFL